jgi:hypothetical protein
MTEENDVDGVVSLPFYWSCKIFNRGNGRMNIPEMPNVMFADDDQKHRAINTLNALQRLLYLIRLDASHSDRVLAYVTQSDALLSRMQTQMLSETIQPDPYTGHCGTASTGPWPLEMEPMPQNAKSLTCPSCKAEPGQDCVSSTGVIHLARMQAAAAKPKPAKK